MSFYSQKAFLSVSIFSYTYAWCKYQTGQMSREIHLSNCSLTMYSETKLDANDNKEKQRFERQ